VAVKIQQQLSVQSGDNSLNDELQCRSQWAGHGNNLVSFFFYLVDVSDEV
jgi:hypothetical protein